MNFSIVLVLFILPCLVVASHLRLPLPEAIRATHPWLDTEPVNSNDQFVKVVGGVDVVDGEVPYQIAMLQSGSFICGGSLIGPQTVLTAAHCVFGYENTPSVFTVRYGTLDRTTGSTVSVSKVNRHPSYSSSTIDFDIATFILSAPFTPGTNAAVIPLGLEDPEPGDSVLLTGWGRLSAGGTLPTHLQKATTLLAISNEECQSRWGSVNAITDQMICAHSTTQSACNGDSGGPLVFEGVQVGVVSWGSSSCLHATYPNVYTCVPHLLSWIQENS